MQEHTYNVSDGVKGLLTSIIDKLKSELSEGISRSQIAVNEIIDELGDARETTEATVALTKIDDIVSKVEDARFELIQGLKDVKHSGISNSDDYNYKQVVDFATESFE